MQVRISLQTDNHASTPPLFFTGRMPFLPPNQQRQSTEGTTSAEMYKIIKNTKCKKAMPTLNTELTKNYNAMQGLL